MTATMYEGDRYHIERARDLGMPIGTGKRYSYEDLRGLFGSPELKTEPIPVQMELYSGGWIPDQPQNIPDIDTAQQIADLFRRNYPPMYDSDLRHHDLVRYKTGEQIIEQVQDGNAWLVARVEGIVVGASKFRRENRSGDPNREEILFAWTLVEADYRERGVATSLKKESFRILQSLKQSGKPVHVIGDVHVDNSPSRMALRSVRFTEESGKGPEFLTVRKIL